MQSPSDRWNPWTNHSGGRNIWNAKSGTGLFGRVSYSFSTTLGTPDPPQTHLTFSNPAFRSLIYPNTCFALKFCFPIIKWWVWWLQNLLLDLDFWSQPQLFNHNSNFVLCKILNKVDSSKSRRTVSGWAPRNNCSCYKSPKTTFTPFTVGTYFWKRVCVVANS